MTILLAGLAAFAGARLGSERTPPRANSLSDRVFDLIGDGQALSPAQREAITAVGNRLAPAREELRMKSQMQNAAVLALLAEEQRFGPRTEAGLRALQVTMGERLELSLQYMLEVRQQLTPAQRIEYDRHLAEEAAVSR